MKTLVDRAFVIVAAFGLVAGSLYWKTSVWAQDLSTPHQDTSASVNDNINHAPLRPIISGNGSSPATSQTKDSSSLTQLPSISNQANSRTKQYIPQPAPTGASPRISQPTLGESQIDQAISGPTASGALKSEGERISLERPELKALISVNDYLSPFSLDADSAERIKLRDVLLTGMDRNLDLAISVASSKVQQWNYYGALGKFLPDFTMNYQEIFPKGEITFPFNTAAGSVGPVGGSGKAFKNDTTVKLRSPFIIMGPGFRYWGYRGGAVLFGALAAKHNYKAAVAAKNAALSDTLFTLAKDYYDLVLNEALLQIKIQAVKTSEEQLRENTDLFHSGLATNLDVLQSATQLSKDRQDLVHQQISRRDSSIALATDLNAYLGTDLLPVDTVVKKVRLIDPRLTVSDLLRLAIDNRPELKQYEELRLAAKRAIIVAGAPLQPTFALTGNIYGLGPPSQIKTLYTLGLNVNWQLGGFGTVDVSNVEASRWQARIANLQSNKELVKILGEVRSSILASLDTEHNIDEASAEVTSAVEELRLAQLRVKNGLGTNLDIINAQHDYTRASVDKAQTIINFNIAQAKLLHDIGLISVDSLSSGRLLTK